MAVNLDGGAPGDGKPAPTAEGSGPIGLRQPPFDAPVQRRIKALIVQVQRALQRHQLDGDVEDQLHQLAIALAHHAEPERLVDQLRQVLTAQPLSADARQELAELLGASATAIQADRRLDRLVQCIDQYLSAHTLSPAVQLELGRLLSLMATLRHHPQYVGELELAVSALLPGIFAANAVPGDLATGFAPAPASPPDRLRLAQSLRNHLRLKTRQNSFPLRSLLSASGSEQNRLFSGLSWFLLIFSLLPALAYGGMMLLGLSRIQTLESDLATVRGDLAAAQANVRRQERRAGFYEGNLERVGTRLDGMEVRNQTLVPAAETAAPTSSWVGYQRQVAGEIQGTLSDRLEAVLAPIETPALGPQQTAELAAQLENLEADLDYAALAALLIDLHQKTTSATATDPAIGDAPAAGSFALLGQLIDRVEADLREQQRQIGESRAIVQEPFPEAGEGGGPPPVDPAPPETAVGGSPAAAPPLPDSPREAWSTLMTALLATANQIDLPLVLAVVSAGALGGFVSVIVRAGDLVKDAEEKPLDLFFVGFFRPVVGMTFAFFLVAVIESGILSGIVALGGQNQREGAGRSIYLYIAISFVAGFSERLVRDFVSQTERQISGRSAAEGDGEA